MKKIIALVSLVSVSLIGITQENPASKKEKIDLSGRSNDHFMVQLGYTGWTGKPDSINTKGLSRCFNVYFLFDFPFKTNPHFSVAIGPGIGSNHVYFDKTYVGIKDQTTVLNFTDRSDTTHYKKTKLTTVWLEAPVELRYSSDPLRTGKSFKAAIGLKVGTMLTGYTRSKDLQNASGQSVNDFYLKEYSKRFFNTNHLVFTARAGYGRLTAFYSHQLGPLFKSGTAAEMKPYSIGLTLSGL